MRGARVSGCSSGAVPGHARSTLPRPRVTTPARSSVARKRLALSREVPASCAISACVARISTSSLGRALGLARRPSGRAARWPPGRRPSGTTAASSRSLVRLHALGQRREQLQRDVGVAPDQARDVAGQQRHRAASARSPRRWPSASRRGTSPARRTARRARSSASATMRPSWCSRVSTHRARAHAGSRCRRCRPRGR